MFLDRPVFLNRAAGAATASLLALAAVALPAAASAAIVVASSGPSASKYPVGTKIAPDTRVTLKAGDSVTVLDDAGTRVLRGEGTVRVDQRGGGAVSSAFTALTRQRSASRVRTGAVRGSDAGEVRSPNLWYVDARQGGTVCILDTWSVQVWRATSDAAQTLRVTPARAGSGGESAGETALSFPAGAMIAPWDTSAAPIADGSAYRISGDGAAARQVTFAVLPAKPASPEATAALLIEKGCSVQLDLLAASLARGAG